MLRRRKGFTLIELLVVIAIIGILAAMLFPVFAKARESARRVQCLSNVKNIAIAVQMYLTDWERFWPSEHERFIIDYFNTAPGGGSPKTWPDICNHTTHANPYIREPVLLDEYIKNRDVWKCPSATLMNGAQFIVPMGPNGHWWEVYQANEGGWGKGHWDDAGGPCYPAFPPGWGGSVTNSMVDGEMAVTSYGGANRGTDHNVFVTGYSMYSDVRDLPTSAIEDPARYIVVGDGGRQLEFWDVSGIAFPDHCHLNVCGICSGTAGCCNADWVNCELSQNCGVDWTLLELFWTTPNFRKQYTRHMGGSNIGFADGHAKFFLTEALLNGTPPVGNEFENPENCTPLRPDVDLLP